MQKAFELADENASAAVSEVPTPEPGAGRVRLRVLASSVNGYDAFVASGTARGMMEHRYPVSADPEGFASRKVGAAKVLGQADSGPYSEVLRMTADGSLTVPITRTFTFDELPEALGLVGKRRSRGKVAVTIGS
jgi:NADPH:quinone reductase-like Zn-dependent oxidoreductase